MTDAYGALKSRIDKIVSNKYHLVRKLGEGGMGEVYEAVHVGIGRPVAVKVLHPHLTSNEEIVSRFQREAQSAGSLVDENIAAVTDFGVAEDGAPYLVMEFLEGENLGELLARSGPLPVARAAYIIIQACRGLAAAHRREIVHRDLKPENLFICKRNDGTDLVKVLDFGIAKLRTGAGLTHTGITMGTPFYMSPEQARGAKDVDHETDIYALGVILYEILSGKKPHPGDSYNEILYHVLNHTPVPLESLRPGLPPGLSAVASKAMAIEPSDRFVSVAELMEALVPFAGRTVTPLGSRVGLVAAKGMTMPSPESVPAAAVVGRIGSEPPTSTESRIPGSRSRLLVFSVGAAVLVFLAILLSWRGLRREPPPRRGEPVVAKPAPLATTPAVAPKPLPPVEPPAPTPAIAEPAVEKIGSPPPRPPGRPAGQARPKRATPASEPESVAKTPEAKPPVAAPAENPEIPPTPRRKAVRSIDRQNPFDE